MLAFNIVGLGGGPLAIGMVSDALSAAHRLEPLRIALLSVAPVAVLAAVAYFVAAGAVSRDTAAVLQETGQ